MAKKNKKKKEKGKKNKKSQKKKSTKKSRKKARRVMGVLNIYSSKNNTIIHATDITGAETLSIKSGGEMVRSQREESSPYAAMQATKEVIREIKDKGINRIYVKIRAPGGYNGPHWTWKGAQAAIKTISRSRMKIEGMENVTPVPHGRGCRPKGGKRGRRV